MNVSGGRKKKITLFGVVPTGTDLALNAKERPQRHNLFQNHFRWYGLASWLLFHAQERLDRLFLLFSIIKVNH